MAAADIDFSLSFYSAVLAIYSSSILLHSLCSFKLLVYFVLNSLFEHNLVSKLTIVANCRGEQYNKKVHYMPVKME